MGRGDKGKTGSKKVGQGRGCPKNKGGCIQCLRTEKLRTPATVFNRVTRCRGGKKKRIKVRSLKMELNDKKEVLWGKHVETFRVAERKEGGNWLGRGHSQKGVCKLVQLLGEGLNG